MCVWQKEAVYRDFTERKVKIFISLEANLDRSHLRRVKPRLNPVGRDGGSAAVGSGVILIFSGVILILASCDWFFHLHQIFRNDRTDMRQLWLSQHQQSHNQLEGFSCSFWFYSIILKVSFHSSSTSFFLLPVAFLVTLPKKKKKKAVFFKIPVLILFNHIIIAAWTSSRGTNDLFRKNIDIACLPGMLWDSQAHHFHVPCQRSNEEVSSQSSFKNIVIQWCDSMEMLLHGMSLILSH